jgi:hypothetical protein
MDPIDRKSRTQKKHPAKGRVKSSLEKSEADYAATSAQCLRRRLKYAPIAPATNAELVRISVPGSGTEV